MRAIGERWDWLPRLACRLMGHTDQRRCHYNGDLSCLRCHRVTGNTRY